MQESLEYSAKSDDFFSVLNLCSQKAVEIAHRCFKVAILKHLRIKEEEYDPEKGKHAIFVAEFKVFSENHGFSVVGVAHASTPDLGKISLALDATKDLASILGVYLPSSYPDEDLEARIKLETMPLPEGNFEILITVRKVVTGKYEGSVFATFQQILSDTKEAKTLVSSHDTVVDVT